MNDKWKARIRKIWRGWVRPLLIVLIVLGSFRSAIADWNDVPTGSMKPSILEGDRIFVNKLAYDLKVPFTTWHIAEWGGPARGDIVVFYSPADGKRLVKRVVGLPGDTVEMRDDHLTINAQPLGYELVPASEGQSPGSPVLATEQMAGHPHPILVTPRAPAMRTFGPVAVPAGKYFMMGDNRDNSLDSRYIGCVDRKLILGRSSTIVLSVDPKRSFLPRWERFFHPLP